MFDAQGLTRHKTPTLAPMLFKQAHIGDRHAPIHRFAHVINGQQSHLYRGQGFHLHTGLPNRLHRGCACNAVCVLLQANSTATRVKARG